MRYALIFLLMIGAATAQEHTHEHMMGHQQYHAEYYSKWQQSNGGSCCNDADCAPVADRDTRRGELGIEVRIDGEWTPVMPEKIRPYLAPDLQSHLCHVGKTIFCFVFGGGA